MPCNKKNKKERYKTGAELERWADKVAKELHQITYELHGSEEEYKGGYKIGKKKKRK